MEKKDKKKITAAVMAAVLQYIDDEKKNHCCDKTTNLGSGKSARTDSSAWKFFGRHLNFNVRYLIQTKMFNR